MYAFCRRARIAFGDQLQYAAAESGRRRDRDGQTVAGTSPPPPGQCCPRHGNTTISRHPNTRQLENGKRGAFARAEGISRQQGQQLTSNCWAVWWLQDAEEKRILWIENQVAYGELRFFVSATEADNNYDLRHFFKIQTIILL